MLEIVIRWESVNMAEYDDSIGVNLYTSNAQTGRIGKETRTVMEPDSELKNQRGGVAV